MRMGMRLPQREPINLPPHWNSLIPILISHPHSPCLRNEDTNEGRNEDTRMGLQIKDQNEEMPFLLHKRIVVDRRGRTFVNGQGGREEKGSREGRERDISQDRVVRHEGRG